MAIDVELRKIAHELAQLNKTLFQMHRTLKELVPRQGIDQIPKMVEELSEVVSETPRKQSEYEAMQQAIREHNDRRRYQKEED